MYGFWEYMLKYGYHKWLKVKIRRPKWIARVVWWFEENSKTPWNGIFEFLWKFNYDIILDFYLEMYILSSLLTAELIDFI